MHRFIKILTISIVLLGLMIGCNHDQQSSTTHDMSSESKSDETKHKKSKDQTDDIEITQENKKLYHEIGETFDVQGYYSEEPLEVTVQKIWMEDGDEHRQYIEENVSSPEDNATVTFIEFTVTNLGTSAVPYVDIIPKYVGDGSSGDEIDLSYPENDQITDYYDAFDLELEPGKTKEIIGAVATTTYSENVGAYIWNFTQDIPEVVFQTPQSERRDAIGIYDIGEDIYLVDQTEDHQFVINIHDIRKAETNEVVDFKSDFENNAWLYLELDIKNPGQEVQEVTRAFPTIVVNDEPQMAGFELTINGDHVEDPYYDPEAFLESGDQVKAEIYIEVDESIIDDLQIYYFDNEFLTYPDYAKKINYNLNK